MTKKEMIAELQWCAATGLLGPRSHEAMQGALAALRAPAVTSPHADALVEAQHRAERAEGRLREISDLLADAGVPGGTTIYGGVMMLRERAERAESSLCAPAAGAPPVRHATSCRAYNNYQPPYQDCTCAPPAVAGGDAPENDNVNGMPDLLVRDLVLAPGGYWGIVTVDNIRWAQCYHGWQAVKRNGVVIWRRRQEGQ